MASLFVQARRVCAVYSARAPTYLRRATAGAHAPLANATPRTLAPLAAALSPGKAAARLYATDAGEESAARGWMPTDSVLHADAEELDQEWTPTGCVGSWPSLALVLCVLIEYTRRPVLSCRGSKRASLPCPHFPCAGGQRRLHAVRATPAPHWAALRRASGGRRRPLCLC